MNPPTPQTEHTPTTDKEEIFCLHDANGKRVTRAYAERAVNAYEELIKALKSCVESLKRDTDDFGHEVAHINYAIRDAEQAIAKAEGE